MPLISSSDTEVPSGPTIGGIAHDFNDVLMAILANTQLLLQEFVAQDPSRGELEEIERAAGRGMRLTRQLLAVSGQERVPAMGPRRGGVPGRAH